MSPDTNTPEPEVNTAPETTANDEQGSVETEITLADLHESDSSSETKEKNIPQSVPFKKFMDEKKRRKELEKQLAELTAEVESDPDVEDVNEEPEVKKLAERLESIEKKERQAKMEAIFHSNLTKTLENAPEYKGIVNMEVIKQMAFNPANANKTYKQLLEEAYGNAITGRKTVETTTPRGGAKDTKVDMTRAQRDPEYRKEILRDPELRRQYNVGLTDRVFR